MNPIQIFLADEKEPPVIHAYCEDGKCDNAESGTLEDLKRGGWTFSKDLSLQWCWDHEI